MNTIPNTKLQVSTLCLGTGHFGTSTPEALAFTLLDYFIQSGGNFIDTANVYGKWGLDKISTSEIVIGKWLHSQKNRANMVISTKGGHPHLETMHISRINPTAIKSDIEESLHNLQTDSIDLYYLHRDDINIPVGEIIDMMQEHVSTGNIRYYGVSNWSTERIAEARNYVQQKGITGLAANQMMWNFAVPNQAFYVARNMIPMDGKMFQLHQQTGLAAIPYSSQAIGLFTKAMREDFMDQGKYNNVKVRFLNPETRKRITLVSQLSHELGVSGTQIALAYLINQPFTTVPVIGAKTIAHVESSFGALDEELILACKERFEELKTREDDNENYSL